MMTSQRQLAGVAALAAAMAVLAEQKPQMNARELFYVPATTAAPTTETRKTAAKPAVPRPAAKAAPKKATEEAGETVVTVSTASYEGPRPLGLRYSVQRVSAEQESKEVPVDSVFHSGDRVGIAVQPNEAGYLYVVARGSSGKWQVMFPSPEINEGDNWVEGGRRYALPPGSHAWTFDDHKGAERLFVVLARQEVTDLETLIYDLSRPAARPAPAPPAPRTVPAAVKPSSPARKEAPAARPQGPKPLMIAQSATPIDDALVGKLRSQVLPRDLIVEKVTQKEFALYAVEKSGRPDARLVVDVELKHE